MRMSRKPKSQRLRRNTDSESGGTDKPAPGNAPSDITPEQFQAHYRDESTALSRPLLRRKPTA
jgi:hypothetical protein